MFYKLCLYVLGFQNKRGEAPRAKSSRIEEYKMLFRKITASDFDEAYTILKNYSYGLSLS